MLKYVIKHPSLGWIAESWRPSCPAYTDDINFAKTFRYMTGVYKFHRKYLTGKGYQIKTVQVLVRSI